MLETAPSLFDDETGFEVGVFPLTGALVKGLFDATGVIVGVSDVTGVFPTVVSSSTMVTTMLLSSTVTKAVTASVPLTHAEAILPFKYFLVSIAENLQLLGIKEAS